MNFLPSESPGCHVAHAPDLPAWVCGSSRFDPEEFGLSEDEENEVPDISVDPETHMLSVINKSHSVRRSFFISTRNPVSDRNGKPMESGTSMNEQGETFAVTTLVLVALPRSIIDACYIQLDDGEDMSKVDIVSDIKDLAASGEGREEAAPLTLRFPFQDAAGPILCTQGFRGVFTHFYRATQYAIDLQCAVGTPLVAVGSGTITNITQGHRSCGISTENLFTWNSIMLHLDESKCFVEYVHIAKDGACVQKGDTVREGDIICLSGGIGFCPKPHLHIQAHLSDEEDAPTVPFRFRSSDGSTFVPVAGEWYSVDGTVDMQANHQ
eukprot:g2021.t1